MNKLLKYALGAAAAGTTALLAATAGAAQSPTGVWLDHTGRAAVEIANCGANLCGKIVWLKEAGHKDACGMQIIGNVKPVSGGKWDGGWILDPEKNSKYDVEITPLGNGNLKVMGYAGMKFLSETFTWTRAAADIQRCDVTAGLTPSERPGDPAPGAAPGAPLPPPAAVPAPETSPPRREADRTPPPAKGKPKECKLEFGGIKLSFECDDDD
ncbi:MAG: DUF2147 domain-containing protein [Hyphomicrobiaceae bacterium]|nr:DUF2147 domain-containing protein [Hyphomicrobiaceae bacterium]